VNEIKIAGWNESAIHVSEGGPLYDVPFTLSVPPSPEWIEVFDQVWAEDGFSTKRAVRVDAGILHLVAPLDEVIELQLPHLKQLLRLTNERFAQEVAKSERAVKAGLDELEARKAELREFKSKLDKYFESDDAD
jgi:hypothetical protein